MKLTEEEIELINNFRKASDRHRKTLSRRSRQYAAATALNDKAINITTLSHDNNAPWRSQ